MTESHAPSSPERPRNSGPPLLAILVILGIFFIIVFIISVLLLPDRGKRLLRLTSTNPVTQTVAASGTA